MNLLYTVQHFEMQVLKLKHVLRFCGLNSRVVANLEFEETTSSVESEYRL